MAFARAGLEVVAVDVDPGTAAVAQANLADRAEVICADANEVAEQLITAPESGCSATRHVATIMGGCGEWRTLSLPGPL